MPMRSTLLRLASIRLLLLVLLCCLLPTSAVAQEVDSSEDRHLGPARTSAVLAFPLDTLLTAASGRTRFELEVRVNLAHGLALAVRPIGLWLVPRSPEEGHGGGIGGALALQWFTRRALAGPFVALQGGDVEAFAGGQRGRMFGVSAIFGYVISWENGAMLSLGVGLGYWHRAGVLDTGIQVPEILSLRLGTGWGFGKVP